jgi:hypothetical protein
MILIEMKQKSVLPVIDGCIYPYFVCRVQIINLMVSRSSTMMLQFSDKWLLSKERVYSPS